MYPSLQKTLVLQAQRIFYHPLAKDSGLLAATQYVSAASNLLTTMIAARLLGPNDYGLVALAMAYPSLVWSFVGVKTVTVTIRYISGYRARGEYKELLSVVKLGLAIDFFISAICFLVVGISAWWVGQHFYKVPQITWLMIAYAFSFPFYSMVGSSRAVFTSFQRFQMLSIFNVLSSFIKLVFVTGSLFLGFGAPGMVVAISLEQVTTGITMMVVATVLLYREGIGYWWSGSLGNIKAIWHELASFFGWNYLFITLNGFVEQVPVILLGRLRGSEEAGYYRLASNLVTVGSYVEGSLANVAYPFLSASLAVEKNESVGQLLKRWIWKVGLPVSILPISAIPFLPWIIPVVFGPSYEPMIEGTQIMMLKAAVSALFFWLNAYYYASGKVDIWVKSFALYSALFVALGYAGIWYAGFLGIVFVNVFLGIAYRLTMAVLALRSK